MTHCDKCEGWGWHFESMEPDWPVWVCEYCNRYDNTVEAIKALATQYRALVEAVEAIRPGLGHIYYTEREPVTRNALDTALTLAAQARQGTPDPVCSACGVPAELRVNLEHTLSAYYCGECAQVEYLTGSGVKSITELFALRSLGDLTDLKLEKL